MKRLLSVAIAIAAVGLLAWWLTRPDPIAVALVTVERGPVAATVANTRAGTVDTCRRAGLSPALGGQIAVLRVADGASVEEGQLLIELWNEDIKAERNLAERDVRAAHSRSREACVIASVAKRESERLMTLREQGLEVVCRVDNLDARLGLTLRTRLDAGAPRCPTLTGVWRGADWMERECYDMFGVRFEGHPDLRRILLPHDWEGHPLLKSYAVDTPHPPYR